MFIITFSFKKSSWFRFIFRTANWKSGKKFFGIHLLKPSLVQALGWKDPLEKKMATHCSILAWRIPWTEETGRLPSMGSQIIGHK